MVSIARRVHARLLPPGRAEAVGVVAGGVLFVGILAALQRTESGVAPAGLLAIVLLCFALMPRLARELVAPAGRRPSP